MSGNRTTKGSQNKSVSKPLIEPRGAPVPDATSAEQIKLEINVRLEEYKALRAEIVATLSSSHSTTNLTLTAAGSLIAGSTFIIQYHAILLFLLASYGFYLIAWTQLHYVHVVYSISQHIGQVIAPKIRDALARFGPRKNENFVDLLTWEEAGRASGLWAIPLHAARYLFPICAAIASAVGFVVNEAQSAGPWWKTYLLRVGGASTLFLLIYTLYLTSKVRSLTRTYVRNKQGR